MNKLVQLMGRNLVITAERPNHLSPLSRFFNTTNVVFDSKTNIISRKLGIPEVPKKPLTPYFRYLKEVRPSINVKNVKEATTIAAAQWKKLDESQKQTYLREFEKDKVVWLKEKEAHDKKITKEQKLAIADERIRLKELSEKRVKKLQLKNRLIELGKPKRPISAFFLFFSDESKKAKTNARDVKARYEGLTESQKLVYKQKSDVLREEYRKAMQTWEKRMISKGLIDLVSKKPAPKQTKKV